MPGQMFLRRSVRLRANYYGLRPAAFRGESRRFVRKGWSRNDGVTERAVLSDREGPL
jgi:hypothetical protein